MILKLLNRESKTIAGAAFIIGASAVLSRLLGLIRDRLLVSHFGLGDALDAYYASFQVPNFIFALLVLGTLSVAFIPVFADYLARGLREQAWEMMNRVLSITLAVMGGLCLVLSFGAPWLVPIIAPGFSGAKLALAVDLTRVMMLSPFFFAVSAVFSSVLNASRRFVVVSFAPLLYNASIIFGIVCLSKIFGVMGVAYGAVLGAALHLLVQIPGVAALGWKPAFRFDAKHEGVREVGRLFLPRVFGIDISQISQFVGTSIGTTFGTGAPTVFNLAMNIAAVPIGAIAIPFAIAAFPDLSETAARRDRAGFIGTFSSAFRQMLFFLFPLSALALVLRVQIVRVLIGQRGLSWSDTRLAAAAFAFFAVSLALQGLTPLLARAFYALKNTLIPVLVSGAAMIIEIAFVFILKAWLASAPGMGMARIWLGLFGVDDFRVLALPLAFSVASLAQVALLIVFLRRRFGPLGGGRLFRAGMKFLTASLAAAVVAAIVVSPFRQTLDTRSFLQIFEEAAFASLAGLSTYTLTLWFMKSEELVATIAALRRRLRPARAIDR